jgi:broad specificity phosphatase PhoE
LFLLHYLHHLLGIDTYSCTYYTYDDNNKKRIAYDDHIPEHDVSINRTGKQQAMSTGQYLNKYAPFDIIYSSPRKRVIQTASFISKEIGYNRDIIKTDLLLESKAGKLHGLNFKQIQKLVDNNNELKQLDKKLNNIVDSIQKTLEGELIYRQIDEVEREVFNTTPFTEVMKGIVSHKYSF